MAQRRTVLPLFLRSRGTTILWSSIDQKRPEVFVYPCKVKHDCMGVRLNPANKFLFPQLFLSPVGTYCPWLSPPVSRKCCCRRDLYEFYCWRKVALWYTEVSEITLKSVVTGIDSIQGGIICRHKKCPTIWLIEQVLLFSQQPKYSLSPIKVKSQPLSFSKSFKKKQWS